MKKAGTVMIYYLIVSVIAYLALAALRYILSFLMRYWILLAALAIAVYFSLRLLKTGEPPWWLVKLKDLFPRGGKNA